jgi:adenylate cyclase
MAENTVNRKLAAVLYADVADYSRLTRQDEVGTHQQVMSVLDYASDAIKNGGGTVLRYAGDAILAEFQSVVAAAIVAVSIQNELLARNIDKADNDKVRIRIGLNLGEVMQDRGEIFGDGVNLAARLEAAAQPGGVCISSVVHEQIAGKVDTDFVDGGEESFKNIDQPVRVYRWHPEGLAAQNNTPPDLAIENRPSIAVLPFDNLSNDPEQEYFADGITEDIITELSREKDLFVIARNSSSVYKGQSPDIRQVAKDLGVKYVLEGSVRRAGNKIRLNAQLIDGESNRHIWAERYDRSLEDIFEVQDDLSNTIMNTLIQKIQSSSFDRALRRPPQNMIAYDHYVHGMALVLRLNKNDNLLAQQEALKAIELDPSYARGHMLLSWTHLYGFFSGWFEDRGLALSLGHEAALKSIECDKYDFFGYSALGFAELFLKNHERALNAVDGAVRLSPNNADARAMRAIILNYAGNPEEALREVTLAIRHNPSHPDWYLIGPGRALFMLERYQEALPYLERLVNAGDDIPTWRAQLAATYMALGRELEAKGEINKAIEFMPNLSITEILSVTPFKDNQVAERYAKLLSKAGLPD